MKTSRHPTVARLFFFPLSLSLFLFFFFGLLSPSFRGLIGIFFHFPGHACASDYARARAYDSCVRLCVMQSSRRRLPSFTADTPASAPVPAQGGRIAAPCTWSPTGSHAPLHSLFSPCNPSYKRGTKAMKMAQYPGRNSKRKDKKRTGSGKGRDKLKG